VIQDPPALKPDVARLGRRTLRLRPSGRFAVASTSVSVDRATSIALSVSRARTGVPVRLSPGSRIGAVALGRARLVLRATSPASGRVEIRIRLPLEALSGAAFTARIRAANPVGTDEVSLTLRR
jgi:hypothetical protein